MRVFLKKVVPLLAIRSWLSAFAWYTVLLIALFSPYLSGEIIAPHRQHHEIGSIDQSASTLPENRKFSDFSSVYIPEVINALHGDRSGWLAP